MGSEPCWNGLSVPDGGNPARTFECQRRASQIIGGGVGSAAASRAGGFAVAAVRGIALGSSASPVVDVRVASCVDGLDAAMIDLDRLLANPLA